MATLAVVTAALQPAWSALYAGRFPVWPNGEDWQTVLPGQQAHVCGGWRVIAGHSSSTGPTVRVRKASSVQGGLELEATYGTATDQPVYVRQLVPDLQRMAGRAFVPTFRVRSAATQQWDVYARSRYNADDAQRLPVVDTQALTTPAGDSTVAVPCTVPALTDPLASGWPMTWRSCVEVALRLWGTSSTRKATVLWGAMPMGTDPAEPPLTTPQQDADAVAAYEEVVPFRLVGLASTLGQKATWVGWKEKALPVDPAQVSVFDALGNEGYVSGYVAKTNRRVDRVPVTVAGDPIRGLQAGCALLLPNTSSFVGLSGRVRVASY